MFKGILSVCLKVYCHHISAVLRQNYLRRKGVSTRSSHGHKIETADQLDDHFVRFHCTTYWRIIMDIKMSSV